MRSFRIARGGARVGICVLALGVAGAAAQETAAPGADSTSAPVAAQDTPNVTAQPETQADIVKPEDSSGQNSPIPAGTSELPELVVDGKKDDKKKKSAKSKEKVDTATSTSDALVTEPPPGVVLGTTAPSDTGTSTFDANNVRMRATGGGDANSFLRNLPNVQYQNNASTNAGTDAASVLDTKPALMSISGGRVYENNFIVNGVSVNNITGAQDYSGSNILRDKSSYPDASNIYGMSPQNIYVPADFIGKATVIDSNASAEYGQFQGGVVIYDLAAPPTDKYHASVSATHESSDYASYVLATPKGTNPLHVVPPVYDKTKLSASLGAPITKDFSFIAQASRQEATSGKPRILPIIGDRAEENSDNTFLRFAATARTEIGKFTYDTSYTHYFQHWEYNGGRNMILDTNTTGSTNKLEYETGLPGVAIESIGLGSVNLLSRTYYNSNETQNNSNGNYALTWYKQYLKKVGDTWQQAYVNSSIAAGWCGTYDAATYSSTDYPSLSCSEGGFGNTLQGQTDYGVDAKLSGNILLGGFKLGAEVKQYEGHRARAEDYKSATGTYIIGDDGQVYRGSNGTKASSISGGQFICNDPTDMLCSPTELFTSYTLYPKYDVNVGLNAIHSFAEIDQTWKWFNARAGARLDYDDYFKNINIAPRIAGTFTPFDGLSFTGGVNRYYLGESLYYAIRDKQPYNVTVRRIGSGYDSSGTALDFQDPSTAPRYNYGTTAGLNTPYSNEYTGAVGIRDPLLGGFIRLKYLERYGEEQFATTSCGTNCFKVTNDGENFYRSKTVEYTKQWNLPQNPLFLNAAAITGNATWSDQKTGHSTYLINTDFNGDGADDSSRLISYKGRAYRPEEFSAITGNLDIPVRIGATLASVWFDGALELNANAGINLGYQGVYNTRDPDRITPGCTSSPYCYIYDDKNFGATLKLDVSGRYNVSEQAAIDFHVDNITNSAQNAIANDNYPWVLGRTIWIGSTVKLQ